MAKRRPKSKAEHVLARRGAQPGNNNATKHGGYVGMYSKHAKFTEDEIALIVEFCTDPTLDDEIILQRIANARMTESLSQALDIETQLHIFTALNTGMGRVASLLRTKRALSNEAVDGIANAFAAAIAEIATEMGYDLT